MAEIDLGALPLPAVLLDGSGALIADNAAWRELSIDAHLDSWAAVLAPESAAAVRDLVTRRQAGTLSLQVRARDGATTRRQAHVTAARGNHWLLLLEPMRATDTFSAHISHELRTPLNAIIGIADLLSESVADSQQQRLVGVLRNAGEHLLDVINDVLDFSTIEAGHVALQHIDFNLRDLLEQTTELLAARARGKNVEVVCHIAEGVPVHLVGDPLRIRQVIVNLVGNAIKFTERGEVVVRVERVEKENGEWLHVSVRDTGIGIVADRLDAIFDDFQQADGSIAGRFGGTGLGLGIVRRLVHLMGGTVAVESQLGRGSTFTFTLPCVPQPRPVGRTSSSILQLDGQPMLVIAESETHRVILGQMLTGWGAATDEAATAERGLQLLAAAARDGLPYRLVVLDEDRLQLGATAFAQRMTELGASAPVIVVAMERGAPPRPPIAARLGKPVRRRELMEAIAAALDHLPGTVTAERPRLVDPRALRVLVVDDTEENRLLLRHYLADCGYVLDFADNGRAAVERYAAHPFDVVLMDLQMPVYDGLSATRDLRELERARGLSPSVIIALTARATPDDVAKSLAAGCTTHLSKPVRRDAVLRAILKHAATIEPIVDGGPPMPATVELMSDLLHLMDAFIAGRRKDERALAAAVEDQNFETVEAIGHTMRGLGSSYGLDYISALGASLEAAAGRRDVASIEAQRRRLGEFVDRVEAAQKGH